MTTYLLDANVFIQAKNLHYGFDFCPAFWDWLDEQNNAARVFSIERVKDEILAGDDELAAWARQRAGLFLPPDETMVPSLRVLILNPPVGWSGWAGWGVVGGVGRVRVSWGAGGACRVGVRGLGWLAALRGVCWGVPGPGVVLR